MILLNKKPGDTPLAAINAFRTHYASYQEKKLAYAGRLDPLAEGLLLILEGNETKKREQYEKLEKVYSFDILFGVATDSYDILGEITESTDSLLKTDELQHQLTKLLPSFLGTHHQAFPPYSAARVQGKPLYYWTRKGLLHTISIPEKVISISSLTCVSIDTMQKHLLQQKIRQRIDQVTGDFRQQEIHTGWDTFFAATPLVEFMRVSCSVHCSSGTYVRSLAHTIGQKLSLPSLAWRIKREAIGAYQLHDAIDY